MKLHSNEEIVLIYASDGDPFTSRDVGIHGYFFNRLVQKGLLRKVNERFILDSNSHRVYVHIITQKGKDLLKSRDYIISNKCVICGELHNKCTKTCSDKCARELARSNLKNFAYQYSEYEDQKKMFRSWLSENDYPMFVGARKLINSINHGIKNKIAYRVLYSVLEDNGYVRYNTNRTYIRKDCIASDGVMAHG